MVKDNYASLNWVVPTDKASVIEALAPDHSVLITRLTGMRCDRHRPKFSVEPGYTEVLVEFELRNYKDGSEVIPPESPEDVPDGMKLVVKDSSGIKQTLLYEPGGIGRDEGKNRYKTTLNFQKDGYENGEYTLEVYLGDILLGSRSLIIERK